MVINISTVTGEDASVFFVTHAGGTIPSFTSTENHAFNGMSEFSLTLDRGTVEQDLIGQAGNYMDQGSLSMDGSFTISKFGGSGSDYALQSIINGTGTSKYVAISGQVSDGTDATYLKWYLVSCQITGYDITIGDADAITEASIDYIVLDPHNIEYTTGLISDSVKA